MERYLSAAWKISGVAVASPKITPSARDVPRARRSVAARSRGGPADRHARRHLDPPLLPRGRRVRDQPAALSRDGQHHPRPGAGARSRSGDRRRSASCLARFGGPKDEQANYLQPTLAGDEMEKRFQKRLHRHGRACTRSASRSSRRARPRRWSCCSRSSASASIRSRRSASPSSTGSRSKGRSTPAAIRASSPSRQQDLHLPSPPPTSDAARVRANDPDDAGAPRLPRAGERRGNDAPARLLRQGARRTAAASTTGIEGALTFLLVQPAVPVPRRAGPGQRRAGRRSTASRDLELASRLSFFLWSSIPDDELLTAADAGTAAEPGRARAAGAPDAEGRTRAARWPQLRRPVAVPAQRARPHARRRRVPGLRPQPARRVAARDRDALRERRARGPQRRRRCSTPTTRS